MKFYSRPYPEPEARTFKKWCEDLGLQGNPDSTNENRLSYDDFCFMPNTIFRKIDVGNLYNWWRKFGDKWGECRTIKEWINDFNWDINELEQNDLKDLNLFIGHDEFWKWSGGKLSNRSNKSVDK